MTRYAVLLRAVNLGSHNKVPMAWLREAAAGAGYSDVATYVQSGNLVVSTREKPAQIAATVNRLIAAEHALDISVVVRSRDELAKVVKNNPFPEHADDLTGLHVTFLDATPTVSAVKVLDHDEFAPERFEVRGSEVYFWYPDGLGRSKMAVAAPWAKRLGMKGTDRNWRTVLTLLDLLGG